MSRASGLLAGAFAVVVLASPARADPGIDCSANFQRVPEDGAIGVPTNVRPTLVYDGGLFNRQAENEYWIEEDTTGERVGTAKSTSGFGGWSVVELIPESELRPNTQYILLDDATDGDPSSGTAFTTGDGPDLDPPEGIEGHSVDGYSGPVPGAGESFILVSVGGTGAGPGVQYQVQVSGTRDFSDSSTIWWADPRIPVGEVPCLGFPDTYEGVVPGTRLWLRVRALDSAGNAGEWTTAESGTACGCQSAGAPLAAGPMAALACLLAASSRRSAGGRPPRVRGPRCFGSGR